MKNNPRGSRSSWKLRKSYKELNKKSRQKPVALPVFQANQLDLGTGQGQLFDSLCPHQLRSVHKHGTHIPIPE